MVTTSEFTKDNAAQGWIVGEDNLSNSQEYSFDVVFQENNVDSVDLTILAFTLKHHVIAYIDDL